MFSRDIYENYFSLSSFVAKRVDAIWEVVRSVIIPYTNGADYRENLLLRMVRVMGIVFPGICDHGPQDYVNATRLGNPSCILSNKLTSKPRSKDLTFF